jgi:hypothetical protein
VVVDEDGFDLGLVLRGSDKTLVESDETSEVLAKSVEASERRVEGGEPSVVLAISVEASERRVGEPSVVLAASDEASGVRAGQDESEDGGEEGMAPEGGCLECALVEAKASKGSED